LVTPTGGFCTIYQLSASALKKGKQRAKYSLKRQKAELKAAKVRMRRKRNLHSLDGSKRYAQIQADIVRQRKKREVELLDATRRHAQKDADKCRKRNKRGLDS